MKKQVFLTEDGLKKLENELEDLKSSNFDALEFPEA